MDKNVLELKSKVVALSNFTDYEEMMIHGLCKDILGHELNTVEAIKDNFFYYSLRDKFSNQMIHEILEMVKSI